MDYADRDSGGIAFGSLPGRVRELSGQLARRIRLASPKPAHLRKIKAGLFIFLAIFFGIIACRLNRQETELAWKRSHLPDARIWTSSFAAEGFRKLANPTLIARVTRNLPTLADTAGEIWKAPPDWWAIEALDGSEPLLFCFHCAVDREPHEWTPEGSGWDGWELAMTAADKEALLLRSHRQRLPKRGVELDPREIRY